jgi:hypothetical protein
MAASASNIVVDATRRLTRSRPCDNFQTASHRQEIANQRQRRFARSCSFDAVKNILIAVSLRLSAMVLVTANLYAADPDALVSPSPESTSATRYGLFDWLDHRSEYGQGVFPEPFLVDDSDLEINEFRIDWEHARGHNQEGEFGTVELEKGFGQMTVELELHYERDMGGGSTIHGFDNIDIGARYPIQQYVSPGRFVDSTWGVGIEAGIPVQSVVSKNAELVPKIFNDLRLGDHFNLQSVIGYSTLFGGGPDGGLQTFEYGFVFGFPIQHKELPLPDVLQFIPVFELSGNTELNQDTPGSNSLIGNAAFRLNLKPVGGIQPRLGFGYVFPIDHGAGQDLNHGFFTSLVFEF